MRPQVVLQNETGVLAEIDIDFRAPTDQPDFPLGPMKAGDVVTTKVLASYTLRGDKVARVTTMAGTHGITASVPPF